MIDNQLFTNSFSSLFMVVRVALNTTLERFTSNARHAVGDGDGGEARAITKRTPSNARHAIGDGDRGKAKAILERRISNARHLACPVHVGYFLRYSDIALIFIRIIIIIATTESNLQFRAIINVVVIKGNAIGILNFNVVGTSYQW
jgi:hypothetical protein